MTKVLEDGIENGLKPIYKYIEIVIYNFQNLLKNFKSPLGFKPNPQRFAARFLNFI